MHGQAATPVAREPSALLAAQRLAPAAFMRPPHLLAVARERSATAAHRQGNSGNPELEERMPGHEGAVIPPPTAGWGIPRSRRLRIGVLAGASTPAFCARLHYSPARAARTHRAGDRRPYGNSNSNSNTTLTFSGAVPSARSAWLSLGGDPSTQQGCPLAWVYHQPAASLLASCAALARSSSEQRMLDAGTPPNRPPRVEE